MFSHIPLILYYMLYLSNIWHLRTSAVVYQIELFALFFMCLTPIHMQSEELKMLEMTRCKWGLRDIRD